jgi:hypothetical protein
VVGIFILISLKFMTLKMIAVFCEPTIGELSGSRV